MAAKAAACGGAGTPGEASTFTWPACAHCGAAPVPPSTLNGTWPVLSWHPRQPGTAVSTDELHWGQRKLLISEVDFLTRCARPGDLVVYAGAAPGDHIPLLAGMFPRLTLTCYDPRPFAFSGSSQVKVVQESFDADTAALWKGRASLFICDIRTEPVHADSVARDMAEQAAWVRAMRPRASLLKFRLPWGSGVSEYLGGEVLPQAYAQGRSTESRLLVCDPDSSQEWDNAHYEGQMFWWNTVMRSRLQPLPGVAKCLPGCWDGQRELQVLHEYFSSCFGEGWGGPVTSWEGVHAASWRITLYLASFKASRRYRDVWLQRADSRLSEPAAQSPLASPVCARCLASDAQSGQKAQAAEANKSTLQ